MAFDECTLTSDLCYSAVIERVLNERVFWADTVLTKLLRERLVPEWCVTHSTCILLYEHFPPSLSFADQLLTVVLAHTDWVSLCTRVLCSLCCKSFSSRKKKRSSLSARKTKL